MDEWLLRKLLDRFHVPTPGDSSHVSCPGEPRRSIEVAVVHHHRLAFYYWLRWSTNDWRCSLPENQSVPDLITLDWHDDVGGEVDCVFDELDSLVHRLEVDGEDEADLEDAVRRRRITENNVAGYSFLGLRALNDGHIYPAQYLNEIGNVYVLNKQKGPLSYQREDRFGNPHETHYVKTPRQLFRLLDKSDFRPTYFDLDVDYFFRQGRGQHRGGEIMVPEDQIRSLLDLRGEMMTRIFERGIRGMTIALEPTYCGGLRSCFEAMSIISDTLFKGSLLSNILDWQSP